MPVFEPVDIWNCQMNVRQESTLQNILSCNRRKYHMQLKNKEKKYYYLAFFEQILQCTSEFVLSLENAAVS